mgnify:CR=1 FL=1
MEELVVTGADLLEDSEIGMLEILAQRQAAMDALGDDGASHEGVGYWEYGVEYLLKFMHLARQPEFQLK